ncbi:DUF3307 domain-containing protein [Sulfitobacter sp. S0837]|uniref:DUF3307 domain-containing protein n=1 Tax=Sulfitobacter maritimus TaxID=2741719 RepID=UPI0015833672|nr:DUF3307 domain-containing protein [Sulfitobacter maritimus]NUH66291.1 DUF3307 domain-containing protein [Sulfitobacter maritimus]
MSDPFIATGLACLTAHMLADFIFQPDWMVAQKRRPGILLLHAIIVFVLTAIALGGSLMLAAAVGLAHLTIDAVKVYATPPSHRDRLWPYLGDQSAHLITIALAAYLMPEAFSRGVWAEHTQDLLTPMALLIGLIAATFAGGPAVGGLMARYKAQAQPDGLDNAGRIIGLLERALIYLMVMVGDPIGIGFLIAAKSILRFDTASQSREISEYVIIGTLASFGWALTIAFATQSLITLL